MAKLQKRIPQVICKLFLYCYQVTHEISVAMNKNISSSHLYHHHLMFTRFNSEVVAKHAWNAHHHLNAATMCTTVHFWYQQWLHLQSPINYACRKILSTSFNPKERKKSWGWVSWLSRKSPVQKSIFIILVQKFYYLSATIWMHSIMLPPHIFSCCKKHILQTQQYLIFQKTAVIWSCYMSLGNMWFYHVTA
jgi:hypothetical protein